MALESHFDDIDADERIATQMALTPKQEEFARACAKGETASAAYRTAYNANNMSAAAVHVSACRLLKNPKVTLRVEELRAPALAAARLDVEETQRQLACVMRSDARKLYRPDGSMIPVHELDADTAAAIASIEVREEFEGRGKNRKLVGYTKKIRFWDKNAAIDKAMRQLGQFERDNTQRSDNLSLQVMLVGAPTNGRD
jgi:phage terminase small subunit